MKGFQMMLKNDKSSFFTGSGPQYGSADGATLYLETDRRPYFTLSASL